MMKKVLFVASVDFHFTGFHIPVLQWFKHQGWEVHVAASGSITIPYVDYKYTIPIQRSPFHHKNLAAYQELKKILEHNQYDIIHCHTPMGGVITRLAARGTRKKGTKVLYTAHGFHFCKGAPLANWLIYYPIERLLAHQTDCLITINSEDYQLARHHKFSAKTITRLDGVGVDTEIFKPVPREEKAFLRFKSGYKQDDFLMFYAAEFNKNKNQRLLLEILAKVTTKSSNAKLLLAGDGPLLQQCRHYANQLGITEHVHFLGHRKDVHEILPMCDLILASSLREGLPVNIMEGMACELPVVATKNRGHQELVQEQHTGCLIENTNIQQAALQIENLINAPEKRRQFGQQARQLILSKYSLTKIMQETSLLYRPYMGKEDHTKWMAQ
ncbi:glycosyltransferase family 4 protein [Fictibacillus nanhaiensis]|nr:glycosyltransferase family 4 protein [Fictibacillus nanhaiensis]